MKRILLGVLMTVALIAAFWQAGRAQNPPATFRIVVEPTAGGFTATCENGCAWKTLAWGCTPGSSACKAVVDDRGVSGTTR